MTVRAGTRSLKTFNHWAIQLRRHSRKRTVRFKISAYRALIWVPTQTMNCSYQFSILTKNCSQIQASTCASNACQYWKFNNILEIGKQIDLFFETSIEILWTFFRRDFYKISFFNWCNFLHLQWSNPIIGCQSKVSICASAWCDSTLSTIKLYGTGSRSTASKAITYKLGNELGDNVLSPERSRTRYNISTTTPP